MNAYAPRPQSARRRQRQQQVTWFRMLLGISLVGMMGLLQVHLHGQVVESEFELSRSRQGIAQARQDIQTARIHIAQMESPDRIETEARRQLSMVRPVRVVYIEKSAPPDGAVAVNSLDDGGQTRP